MGGQTVVPTGAIEAIERPSDSRQGWAAMSLHVRNHVAQHARQFSREHAFALGNATLSVATASNSGTDQIAAPYGAAERSVKERGELLHGQIETVTGVRKWTGRVVEVEEDGEVMTVELTPFGDTETTFVADFSTELVDSDGAGPVRKGDLIYLTARTVHSERGGVHSTSHIRRRLIGRWGEDELRLVSDKAERDARSLLDLIE